MECNIDNIIAIFEKMASDGFDTSENLKWGHFFFDSNKEKLIDAFNEVKERGYTLENIHLNKDSDWVIQISKIEIHTPESLNSRNEAMNRLANNFEIELYDGWDVGRVEA